MLCLALWIQFCHIFQITSRHSHTQPIKGLCFPLLSTWSWLPGTKRGFGLAEGLLPGAGIFSISQLACPPAPPSPQPRKWFNQSNLSLICQGEKFQHWQSHSTWVFCPENNAGGTLWSMCVQITALLPRQLQNYSDLLTHLGVAPIVGLPAYFKVLFQYKLNRTVGLGLSACMKWRWGRKIPATPERCNTFESLSGVEIWSLLFC